MDRVGVFGQSRHRVFFAVSELAVGFDHPADYFGLIIWAVKQVSRNTYHVTHNTEHEARNTCLLSLILIISGALSNFIDRILFGATIDYIRIFTGVINLADVMIVVGLFTFCNQK